MEEDQVKAAFSKIDINGDGKISSQEFQQMLSSLNTELTQYKANKIFRKLDVNDDGEISFDEFKLWWKSGHEDGLEQLVFLSLQANKILKKVSHKINKTGGIQVDDEISEHDIQISVGQSPPKSYFALNLYANKEAQEVTQKQVQGFTIFKENAIGVILRIGAADGEKGKEAFTDIFEQIMSLAETLLPPEIADTYLSIVKWEVINRGNDVLIGISTDSDFVNSAVDSINEELQVIPQEAIVRMKFLFNLAVDAQSLLESKENAAENLKKMNFDLNFNLKIQSQIMDYAKNLKGIKVNKFKSKLGSSAYVTDVILSAFSMQNSKIHLQYKSAEKLFGAYTSMIQSQLENFDAEESTLEQFLQKLADKEEFEDKTDQIPLFEELTDALKDNGNGELGVTAFVPRIAVSLEVKCSGLLKVYNILLKK